MTCRWHCIAITIDLCCFVCSWLTLAILSAADWPLLLYLQPTNFYYFHLQLNQHFTAFLQRHKYKKKNCQKELDGTIRELILRIAVKAVNNSTSLDRLAPILLIFFLFKIYHLINHHFFSKFWDSKTYSTIAIVSKKD